MPSKRYDQYDMTKPRCISHECERKDTCFYYSKEPNKYGGKYVVRDEIFCEDYDEIEII